MRPLLVLLLIIVPALSDGQSSLRNRSGKKKTLPKPAAVEADLFFTCIPVETPAIPGSDWLTYLQENVVLDDSLHAIVPPGTYKVVVSIVIGKTGCVELVKCKSDSSGFYLGEMAAGIVARYPGQWTPATHNGRCVKTYRLLPLTFIVSKQEEDCNELPLIARMDTGFPKQLPTANPN